MINQIMYQVKCAIITREIINSDKLLTIIVPLVNLLHNDKESGQEYYHYHSDARYDGPQPHLDHLFDGKYKVACQPSRINLDAEFKTFPLIKYRDEIGAHTDVRLLNRDSIKCNHLIDDKCPHKGYDMSEIKADKDGNKTCLHGLKFNSKGVIIN